MKFKFPKHITIGDAKFSIEYKEGKCYGANFSYPTKHNHAFIVFNIGCLQSNPSTYLNMIIHELKEIIQIEQSTRLYNQGNDSYEFHYSHAQHQDLCARLAQLLTKFIK